MFPGCASAPMSTRRTSSMRRPLLKGKREDARPAVRTFRSWLQQDVG